MLYLSSYIAIIWIQTWSVYSLNSDDLYTLFQLNFKHIPTITQQKPHPSDNYPISASFPLSATTQTQPSSNNPITFQYQPLHSNAHSSHLASSLSHTPPYYSIQTPAKLPHSPTAARCCRCAHTHQLARTLPLNKIPTSIIFSSSPPYTLQSATSIT